MIAGGGDKREKRGRNLVPGENGEIATVIGSRCQFVFQITYRGQCRHSRSSMEAHFGVIF
jgi:hypothetical protein